MQEDKDIQYIRKAAQQAAHALRRSVRHNHMTHRSSVRKATHEGHRIEIRTMYEVRVDGRRVSLPLSVDSEGRVTCHALPNYSFQSAVDLVKQVIATYPDDFPKGRRKEVRGHGGHAS